MGGRGTQISEFKVSLVYRVSSRIARATQRNNPVSEKTTTTTTKKKPNKTKSLSWVWWHRPIILALRWLRTNKATKQ